MKYCYIKEAVFLERMNRFTAQVCLDGKKETVHVKNTGRCREILKPGATVFIEEASGTKRKTKYSLVSAYKNKTLINIDSQAPNVLVYEAIKKGIIDEFKNVHLLKKESAYGSSRFDLYYETDKSKGFIEVKGVTLEENGIAKFPDAPTQRGTKHIREMINAVKEGYRGYILFVIQLKGVNSFMPNFEMDRKFAIALKDAKKAGVNVLAYDCMVNKYEIFLDKKVGVAI